MHRYTDMSNYYRDVFIIDMIARNCMSVCSLFSVLPQSSEGAQTQTPRCRKLLLTQPPLSGIPVRR